MRAVPNRVVITILAASLAISAEAGAEVALEARQWSPELTGRIRVDGSSLLDEIDLNNDLGLQDADGVEGRLLVRPSRRSLIRAGWVPLTMSGDQVVSRTIRFLDRDFDVSTRVESDLELEYGRLGFAWQFLSTSDGRFRIGPLVEVKAFRGTATLSAPDLPSPISRSEEFEVAFASAGLLMDLEPSERFQVFAEASVLVDDSQGELLDAEAGVRFFVVDKLALVAGFRRLEINAEDGNDLLDLELEGAFFGASVRF